MCWLLNFYIIMHFNTGVITRSWLWPDLPWPNSVVPVWGKGHTQQFSIWVGSWLLFLHLPRWYCTFFSSAFMVRLQVVVGLPLLLPWWFQSKPCLVMLYWGRLRMCPIQPHFRSLMVFVLDDWPVLIHNSELLIFSGHLICRICRRHLFTNT